MPQTGVRIAPSSSPLEQVLTNIIGGSEEGIGYEESTKNQIYIPEKKGWRKVAAFIGPGFLICIAYIDPGNFQSDLRAGASYRFELLWVILLSSCSALIIQSLSAKLGVVTRKHLAEHCRDEYSKKITIILWLLAEVAIVASDIPEVIGTAFALNILFKVPIWGGVLVTGCSTLLLLALQQYGVRKLEFIIGLFVAIMAICFFIELAIVKPDTIGVLRGLFVPSLQGHGATGIAISLLGAMIMPHNLFLHSALVLTRKVPPTTNAIKDACWYNNVESACALFLAFLINVSIISVSGSMCNDREISLQNKANCANLDLNKASFLLQNVLGKWSKVVFGIALLASGQSSTITGTFAGQYVMQGFLNLRFKAWITNLITRSVAILPSLIAALIGGSSGAGQLIIISSMILAFQLPFTLVPLLKFTSSNVKMGPHVNSKLVMFSTWIIGCAILGINIYFLTTAFAEWIIHGNLTKGSKIAMGIFGFTGITIYLIAIICLSFRAERRHEETQMIPVENGLNRQFDEACS